MASRREICDKWSRKGLRVVQFADFRGESIQKIVICGSGLFPGVTLKAPKPYTDRAALEVLSTAIEDAMFEERIPDVFAEKLKSAVDRAKDEGLPTYIRSGRSWERIA